MNSKNMNYMFNVEYYEGENLLGDTESFKNKNSDIVRFKCSSSEALTMWNNMENYANVQLYTTYPGLLLGLENSHGISNPTAFKCGFTFDYVSGLPYITGSTLKGMLRSYFPEDTDDQELFDEKIEMIRSILEKNTLDVVALRDNIFDHADVFLGAFPIIKTTNALMQMEHITPHTGGKFKNPIPIQLIKVKGNIKFEFGFILKNYVYDGICNVNKEEKIKLFQTLLVDMGIGAKTNVGYGRFSETRTKENTSNDNVNDSKVNKSTSNNNSHTKMKEPICQMCKRKPVGKNPKTGKWNKYCTDCFNKNRK